jgi:hypothetical protein
MLEDANLAGAWRGNVHGLINQGFRTPYFVHAHGLGHIRFSLGIPSRSTKAIEAALSIR